MELTSKTTFEAGSAVPLKDKVELLKRKLDVLNSMASDKEMELARAESLGKRRKAAVDSWLSWVEWVRARVRQIDEQAGMLQRPQLVSLVDEGTIEAEQLIEQAQFPDGITVDLGKTEVMGQAFGSCQIKIIQRLLNDSFGVHGIGGVGKTTLVTDIYNQLLDDKRDVHWITVSQECSIIKLQSLLANCLSVDLLDDKDDEKKRATRLSDTLRGSKDIIILDDVRNNYPLEKVGIPDGCKLILTSRSSDLCQQMGCHELINVEILPEEEARRLFVRNLGNRVACNSELKGIARSVANECSGLPLAITVLSESMRGVDDIFEWRYVLEELRELRSTVCMEDEVFTVLRFSFDRLSDEIARQCFMHFALFPEGHEIKRSELVQHFIDFGLLSGGSSREAASNRGHAVINKLLGVSLLQCGKRKWSDCVKMHGLVRDVAISETKARFLVSSGLGKREIYLEEWTEGLEKISLMDNDIVEIPSGVSPRCPKLTVLLLNGNSELRSIPDEFFKHMPSLQLLDLSDTSIETLPSSIMELDKLAVLYLRGCTRLDSLPPLEKLVSLNMEGSSLKTLANLSRFSHLQYLNLLGTKARMKSRELTRLRKLEILKCHFDKPREFSDYAKYLNDSGRVRCYELSLIFNIFCDYEQLDLGRRAAVLEHCQAYGDVLLPKDIDELWMNDVHGARYGLGELSSRPLTPFTDLKRCHIGSCMDVACFLQLDSDSIQHVTGTILPSLESLDLRELPDLRILVEILDDEDASSTDSVMSPPPSPVMDRTVCLFPSLRRLYIYDCPLIHTLFTAELLPSFVNLEELDVVRCASMWTIVASEATEEGGAGTLPFHLPKLRNLYLHKLRELRRICRNGIAMLGSSIEAVTIIDCHKLERIPLHLREIDGRVSVPPLLRGIGIEKSDLSWWESLAWDHNTAGELLRPLLHVQEDSICNSSDDSSDDSP